MTDEEQFGLPPEPPDVELEIAATIKSIEKAADYLDRADKLEDGSVHPAIEEAHGELTRYRGSPEENIEKIAENIKLLREWGDAWRAKIIELQEQLDDMKPK